MKRTGRGILLRVLIAGLLALMGPRVARAESETPATNPTPETNPLSGNEAAIKEGRSWFLAVCSICHGIHADGVGERGAAADLRVFNKGFTKFVQTVKQGRDVPNRAAKMPAWGGALSDEQIYQIGAYLETLAKEGANWKAATP